MLAPPLLRGAAFNSGLRGLSESSQTVLHFKGNSKECILRRKERMPEERLKKVGWEGKLVQMGICTAFSVQNYKQTCLLWKETLGAIQSSQETCRVKAERKLSLSPPTYYSWRLFGTFAHERYMITLTSGSAVKNVPAMQETQVQSLGREDPLEEIVTHSSVLGWRIPWTEEPGQLWSIGLHRVGYDWSDLPGTDKSDRIKSDYSTVMHNNMDKLHKQKC